MGIFNLLPVFPMDGGRIFRALLAIKLPYLRATYWAAKIGRILAPIFAIIAYCCGLKTVCILFIFIFWVGDLEYKHTLRRDEEERYWAEMSRRLNVVEAASGDSPTPPLLNPGSN
jgi:membrane-associated protease RseP (regulator of RpoE activity)